MRCLFVAQLVSLVVGTTAVADDYLVVSLVKRDDPYHAATARLAELRQAAIIYVEPKKLDDLLPELKARKPRNVGVIVRPETLDVNLVRQFMKLATKIDDDPFLDFAHGFITGDTHQVAVDLIESATKTDGQRREPEVALINPGSPTVRQSRTVSYPFHLRTKTLPQTTVQFAGGEKFGEAKFDTEVIKRLLPEVETSSIVLFSGHGYPSGVANGLKGKHLVGRRFDGSVVMNIACYTGVTSRWFQDDWRTGKRRKRLVEPGESFCLNMLKTGVAAYIAYTCPRPAGPVMLADAGTLATEGISVGELRRRDGNAVVLAHIDHRIPELRARKDFDGEAIERPRNIVTDMLLDSACGGVLFGDPAFTPFERLEDEHPVEVQLTEKPDHIAVNTKIGARNVFYHCGDGLSATPDARDNTMRIHTSVPLGDRQFVGVDVKSLKRGDDELDHRVVTAIEQHRGQRILHVKVVFARPDRSRLRFDTSLHCTFHINVTSNKK